MISNEGRPKKKVLILFEGNHIAYSPTLAQLHDELIKDNEVVILCDDPGKFSKKAAIPYQLEVYKYRTGRVRYFYKIFYQLLLLISKKARQVETVVKGDYQEYFFKFLKIKKFVRSKEFQIIICVDIKNLFFVNAILEQRCYFLSLEICFFEKLLPFVDTKLIEGVITQSQTRFEYMFKDKDLKVFYIQNAPIFKEGLTKEKRSGLIYAGTAWKPFGFEYCLDYLVENSAERLTLVGIIKDDSIEKKAAYQDLLLQERLIVNGEYIPDADVVEFISNYEIGFCFYDFNIEWINNFNYQSAPAGKVFKYLAAGVPVICNKIIGFEFVTEFGCGICIDSFGPDTIQSAVEEIRLRYKDFVQAAINAAKHYSFDKAVIPFLESTKNN